MESVSAKNKGVKLRSIGKSYGGVDTPVIQILKAGKNKPNIWIEAGFTFIVYKLNTQNKLAPTYDRNSKGNIGISFTISFARIAYPFQNVVSSIMYYAANIYISRIVSHIFFRHTWKRVDFDGSSNIYN